SALNDVRQIMADEDFSTYPEATAMKERVERLARDGARRKRESSLAQQRVAVEAKITAAREAIRKIQGEDGGASASQAKDAIGEAQTLLDEGRPLEDDAGYAAFAKAQRLELDKVTGLAHRAEGQR